MASMLEVQADKDSTSQGGDKAFSGLIDDGLKDLKAPAATPASMISPTVWRR
jgi:flagellar hook-length control protein FliK